MYRALRLLPFLCLLAFAQDPAATARKALDLLLAGKYAEMQPMFTEDMKKALPPENLGKLTSQLKSYGPLGTISDAQVSKTGANTVVVYPTKLGAQIINFRFVVNGSGLIMGMFA